MSKFFTIFFFVSLALGCKGNDSDYPTRIKVSGKSADAKIEAEKAKNAAPLGQSSIPSPHDAGPDLPPSHVVAPCVVPKNEMTVLY